MCIRDRYTDKDTLFYKMDDYGKFQYPGMAVRILPLQCEYGPRRKYLWNRMREDGWRRIHERKEKWRNQRAFACVCMVRLLMLCGRGWLGKRIFRDLIHQPQEDVQNYVVRFLNKNVYYPAYVFEEQKDVYKRQIFAYRCP